MPNKKNELIKKEIHPGIAAIIINKKSKLILLIKRRNIPIIQNRGIWSFLFGGKEKNETYLETAYREIKEEISFNKNDLKLMYKPVKTLIKDTRYKKSWYNHLFIFTTDRSDIKLSFENSNYRWANPKDIFSETNYKNVFSKRKEIEILIKKALKNLK
ncbi:MAG: NUDIX domain-containing protein [Candidatus Micrarchaeaceae archaeon]